jgi:hypothetical protein
MFRPTVPTIAKRKLNIITFTVGQRRPSPFKCMGQYFNAIDLVTDPGKYRRVVSTATSDIKDPVGGLWIKDMHHVSDKTGFRKIISV